MIELVLTIAAGSAIALMIVLLAGPIDNLMFTFFRRSGISETQAAMNRMLQEIERARSPSDITTFAATRITFTDIAGQSVDFRLAGTDLMRGSDVLVRNVQSLAFEYMDKSGAAVAAAASIRLVRVTVVVRSGDQSIRMRSTALLRNGIT